MVTKSKPLPRNCEWTRIDCIALSRDGSRRLGNLMKRLNDAEMLHEIYLINKDFTEIEIRMLTIGTGKDKFIER